MRIVCNEYIHEYQITTPIIQTSFIVLDYKLGRLDAKWGVLS